VKYVFCLISLLFVGQLFAQSPEQYIARGDKELYDGFPESALFYYKLALHLDTHFVEANFKTGEAYRAQRNYRRAAKFYSATADLDDQDEFPEALYWLGLMQKQQGKYKEAKRSFQAFLAVYRLRDEFYRGARDEEISCDWAIDHESDEPVFKVLDPDTGLNTIHSEMSPFLVDSNTLYFATMRYESDVVKKSKPVYVEMKKAVKDSNAWSLVDLDLPISDKESHVANGSFSADSTRFYFSKCADASSCSIYKIEKSGDLWSEPTKLGSPVNDGSGSNTQPMIASFGEKEYLYFASDRPSGKGGYDIWYVEVKNGEILPRIRNMGTRINTKGNEITPWFDTRDTMFYFSSNRQSGFGGYDIFKSKGEPGKLNLVENAGTDLNGPADDYYFTFNSLDSLGYFASNRISGTRTSGNETCCNDLYKVQLVPIIDSLPPPVDSADSAQIDTLLAGLDSSSVSVYDKDTFVIPETIEDVQDLLPISLYFHNDRPDPRTMATTTQLTYAETVDEYLSLQAEYLNEISKSDLVDSLKNPMYDQTKRFFATDLTGSLDRINAALNALLNELESGAELTIAVKGYASPLANSDYNLNLTYRRIDAMENFIRAYSGGGFVPYLENNADNGGRLTIEKIPYGESKAKNDISDSGNDRLRAIYSPSAAQERRIEILRVESDK